MARDANPDSPRTSFSTIFDPDLALELIVENLPGLVFVKDDQFRIVAANDAFLALYPEAERDQVIGRTTVEQFPEDQRAAFLEQDRIALETGATEITETIDFPNGERRILLTRKVGHTTSDGERYVIGLSTDVTELEDTRRRANQLSTIVNESFNEVYFGDFEDMTILGANRVALDNLGTSLEALAGRSAREIVDPSCHEPLERAVGALRRGEVQRIALELWMNRADGSRYPLEVQISTFDLDGRKAVIAMGQDTTEIRAGREALRRKNAELLEFAYRTSHDLRAPVVSAAALLERARGALAEARSEDAVAALDRAQALLDRLVTTSTEAAGVALLDLEAVEREPIDPATAIDQAIERVQHLPGFERVRIERIDGTRQPVETSAPRLVSIIEQLLSNAIRFRDPHAADVRIRIETRDEDEKRFVLEIEDDGLGVPPEGRDRLFRMFVRLHPRVADGSGLGLYLVRQSLERLGGQIEYAPTNRGSLFRVVLPREIG